jgi:Ni,Fe-hydrogenase I cytochrome b subunit
MNTIRNYLVNLKTETSPVKLFVPIFLGMTAMTEIVGPISVYLIKTCWKHQSYVFPNPLYGIAVSLFFGVAIAMVISHNHRAEQSDVNKASV